MAEEEETEQVEKPTKPIVLIAVVALVGVAAGAGGGFVAFQRSASPPVQEGVGGVEVEEPEEDPGLAFKERLLTLDPMVVNITGDGYARLLKIRVELACESPEVRDEAEARVSQVRDTILTLVSSKRLADVTGFEGKALLKDDLRDRLNRVLTGGRVEDVLFTEFVVQ